MLLIPDKRNWITKCKFPWKSKERNQSNSYDINIEFCKHLKVYAKMERTRSALNIEAKKALEHWQLGELGVSWDFLQLHFNLSFTYRFYFRCSWEIIDSHLCNNRHLHMQNKLNRNFWHETETSVTIQNRTLRFWSYYKTAVSSIPPYSHRIVNSVITGQEKLLEIAVSFLKVKKWFFCSCSFVCRLINLPDLTFLMFTNSLARFLSSNYISLSVIEK